MAPSTGPAAVPGSRGLLWTILGEFVLPCGGAAWTGSLVGALGVLGVEEKAARQAVARSAERGWLDREKVGRRARWHLSAAGRELLTQGTARIYSFGRDHPDWDGRWLLLLLSVPETRRDLRYRLRVRLGWAGFAPIGGGAWLSPWVGREQEAGRVLRELGVDEAARTFVGGLGRLGDPAALVAEAWELDALDTQYRAFVGRNRERAPVPGTMTEREAFVALTSLVHEWRRFPAIDPELPRSLLPAEWSGHVAAELFEHQHRCWVGPARAHWQAQEDAAGR